MSRSALDKELDDLIANIVFGIGKFIKAIWFGLKKLNQIKNVIGVLICLAISFVGFYYRSNVFVFFNEYDMPKLFQRLIYWIILFASFIYLAILGNSTNKLQEEYRKKFEAIGFRGKSGYPVFISSQEDSQKRILYVFRSDISLGEWRKKKEQLETALDCTILQIENKGSKKIIQILAISSEYKIPEVLYWDDSYLSKIEGDIVIGQGMLKQISFNLNKNAHVLVAGETGSGKSIILRCCLWQMINQNAKIYMIDFKGGVEFGLDYESYGEVVMDRQRAVEVLEMLVEENQKRLALFRKLKVKNLPEYNQKTGKNLCRIGVFCDEIAEMLDKKGISKEEKPIYEALERHISSLARLSRATGINLFLGVQRPDANVLTGQIKNNIVVRICGRFADKSASEIVLNSTAAVDLPDIKGRFLYLKGNELMEFQAYYFDDEKMLHDVEGTSGTMLIDENNSSDYADQKDERSYIYEGDTTKNNKKPESVTKNIDPNELNFDFDDEIEWSVDT